MSTELIDERENTRLALLQAFYNSQLESPQRIQRGITTFSATMKMPGLEDGGKRQAVPMSLPLGFASGIPVVAQGDSWFDYLPGNDIIKALTRRGFAIKNFGTGGDTLENMLFGTKVEEGSWERDRPEHDKVLEAVRKIRPRFFLFSGGGNDIAGPELAAFLNHRDAYPDEPLRLDYLNYMFSTVFRRYYEYMIETVQATHPDVEILIHGYGHAIPTGLGVVNILNWRFVGPWLRPALTAKNILNPIEQIKVIRVMIDTLNGMLAEVAASFDKVHYIDLRNVIADDDWINELHLTKAGYNKVADKYLEVMKGLMADEEIAILDSSKRAVDLFMAGDNAAIEVLRQAN